MLISEDDYLSHYGIKRRSGRYPWGSGRTPEERGASFQKHLADLRKEGLSDTDIAKGFGMSTTQLRATISIAKNAKTQADIAMARRLKDEKQMSNQAIAEQMLGSKSKESTIRAWLAPGAEDKANVLMNTADTLRKRVDEDKYIDIGKGTANQLGITSTKLGNARAILESEGYVVHKVPVRQLGTGKDTTTKVLCPPGTKWSEVMQNRDQIRLAKAYSEDGGRTINLVQPPLSFDSRRLQVVYKEDGGDKADGVIYVRPGAKDLDMGGAHYAQVRIMVDGTHYLKGMAVLKDNLPPGVDLQFNTNKTKGTPVLGSKDNTVLKAIKDDPENPFGAVFRQINDENGNVKSALNLVNTEENWEDWSRNLSSQMLSKQKPALIKSQLDVTYAKKKAQLDEIMALTNPTVKARLLQAYADDMDASSVHLKAASLPGQKTHVILPINSLREHEVYAPNYENGTTLVLIRYPHGGTFEIPELTVNNRNAEGRGTIDAATSAIGINHRVAARLSGADFDGDTVVAIPNNQKRVISSPPLEGLKGFDPQSAYPGFPGMKTMTNTQTEMGKISNLITDMTLAGADEHELAAAVRHSMVVIDAEKHGLNYKQSALDNNITDLKKKYQPQPDGRYGGASTLISRTGAKVRVPDFKLRPASEGGHIDPTTGKLITVPTGKTYNKRTVDPKTGEVSWVPTLSTTKVKRGSLHDDAHDLSSGLLKEELYADYSNRVKDLANRARLEMINNTKPLPFSQSAKDTYSKEVDSLNTKLDLALRHAPLERQAQVIANATVKMKRDANPNMDDDELKKVQSQALKTARARTGAEEKVRVDITQEEWNAIQAGAIRHTRLKEILDKADIDKVKQLATPRTTALMSPTNISRAKALAKGGYTQKEIADELGVSLSTLKRGLSG